MANQREHQYPTAYAVKSDDGNKTKDTNILAYAHKAMMADLKRPLKPDYIIEEQKFL